MYRKRLDMIAENASGRVIADIGTDHAFVPVKLIEKGKCERVIATDLNKGPLDAARRSVEKNGMSDKIELRLGNGLAPIALGECDTVIIAGMGGELLCKILSDGKDIANSTELLILQPMNAQDLLRKYLNENNYTIIDEDITVEGFKVYNLLKVKNGGNRRDIDEFSLHLPEYLYEKPCFKELLAKKKREFTNIKKGLEAADEKDNEKIQKYSGFIERIKELEINLG